MSSRGRLGAVIAVGLAAAAYSHLYDRLHLPPRLPGSFGLIVGGDVVPLLVIPALFWRFALGEPLARVGLRWPGWRTAAVWGAIGFAAVLPFVLVLSQRPEFRAFYPSPAFPPARQHWIGLVFLWLLHHGPQLFATEFLFRGFLLFPLGRALGVVSAIAIQTIPYAVLHRDKPSLEIAQALWAGVVFAGVAWRTRSIVPAFAAHWAVAIAMDWLCFRALHP